MYVCMYVCIYVRMHIYIYIYIYIDMRLKCATTCLFVCLFVSFELSNLCVCKKGCNRKHVCIFTRYISDMPVIFLFVSTVLYTCMFVHVLVSFVLKEGIKHD
jgi:hypothetical protein